MSGRLGELETFAMPTAEPPGTGGSAPRLLGSLASSNDCPQEVGAVSDMNRHSFNGSLAASLRAQSPHRQCGEQAGFFSFLRILDGTPVRQNVARYSCGVAVAMLCAFGPNSPVWLLEPASMPVLCWPITRHNTLG